MTNFIRIKTSHGFDDRFFDVSVSGVSSESLQSLQGLLSRFHRVSGCLICGCRPNGNAALIGVRKYREIFVPVRINVDHHDPKTCPWRFRGFRKIYRKPKLLDQIEPRVRAGTPAAGDEPQRQQDEYQTFVQYSAELVACATANAFVEAFNRHERSATADETFTALERVVHDLKFEGDLSGSDIARRMHCRLRFGLVWDRVVTSRGEPLHAINVHWWRGPSRYELSRIAVNQYALLQGAAEIRADRDHYRKPPYLIVGVENSDGCLQRVGLRAVACGPNYLLPVDSGAEAVFASELANGGAAVFKPTQLRSVRRALACIGVEVDRDWPYLSDFLVASRAPRGLVLEVKELRGRARGADADYDLRLARYPALVEAVKSNAAVSYEEVDGSDFRWETPRYGPEIWPEVSVL